MILLKRQERVNAYENCCRYKCYDFRNLFLWLPSKVLRAIVANEITACATTEIIDEYEEIVERMLQKKQGHLNATILTPVLQNLELIETKSIVDICRDPDDNKFLGCAKDAKALYVVSGDADLLVLKNYEDIDIITAKEFCQRYNL